MAVIGGFRSDLSITRFPVILLDFPEMASPTFALADILIRGRQTNSQVIVSGLPSRRDKKYKGRLIAGYCTVKFSTCVRNVHSP